MASLGTACTLPPAGGGLPVASGQASSSAGWFSVRFPFHVPGINGPGGPPFPIDYLMVNVQVA